MPSIIARKISSAQTREFAKNAVAENASNLITEAMQEFLQTEVRLSTIHVRSIDRNNFIYGAESDAWFHFRADDHDVILKIDRALTLAAADSAIGKSVSEGVEEAITVVDRALASALAQRVALAASAAKCFTHAMMELVRSAWSFEDLKINSKVTKFESFEMNGIELAPNLKCDMTCLFGASTQHSDNNLPETDEVWTNSLAGIAKDIEVSLDANVGTVSTTFDKLFSLEPDAIFKISVAGNEKITLTARGEQTPILMGKLGSSNGVRAIRVQKIISSSRDK